MAIPAGWSAAEWSAYKKQIPMASRWATRIYVTDLNQKHLVDVQMAAFLSGQWNLVSSGDVDRTFQGEFFDIGGHLAHHFDPAVAPTRLIQVIQGTFVDSLDRWLWVPTFTGRPHAVTDNGGGSYSIEAQGKESLHNRGVPARVFHKGDRIVDAIRNYLTATGETHLSIPSSSAITTRLNKDVKFGGASDQMTPLAAMRKIASLAGCQLYWTGAGVATVRKWPVKTAPVFTWDHDTVLSEPSFGTDLSTLKNRWTGGGKGSLRDDVTATGTYSPSALAVGGVPWSDIDFGDDDDTLTRDALRTFGERRVNELVTLATTVQCDVVPFHAVDPSDYAEVRIPGRTETCTIRDASIPIAGSETGALQGPKMSLGSTHNTRRGTYGRSHITGTSRKPKPKKKRRRR